VPTHDTRNTKPTSFDPNKDPFYQEAKIMALRAFHANPSIGGFGGESTSAILLLDSRKKKRNVGNLQQNGDALCQIVKELVDNAVDACETCETDDKNHRVKVEILPYNDNDEILQVTISDNGCGMTNIQNCVNAFQSSKGNSKTAGRYGIGLTLCLLHAQRLVPNSYGCITSATRETRHFTRALYFVDTRGDSVECQKTEKIPKTNKAESGTCVSLLVPVS
jgi:DNA topoisomerase VI subunit B